MRRMEQQYQEDLQPIDDDFRAWKQNYLDKSPFQGLY